MKRKTTLDRVLTNLPFNPSLISYIPFYAKRIKQERSLRNLGVLFIALTFLVQIFAIVAPPQPSLAEVGNDILNGGFSSQGSAVSKCRANEQDFQATLAYFGVSCDALERGTVSRIHYNEAGGQLYSIGRAHKFGNDVPVTINGVVYYMRPLMNWGADCYQDGANCMAIRGTRANGTPFMVLFACGNIVIVGPPTAPPPPAAKEIICSNMIMSIPTSSRVKKGTTVTLQGVATGKNLPKGELVDFWYDYVNVDTKTVVVPPQLNAQGVGFVNGTATDPNKMTFTLNQPGHYLMRLAVKYEGSTKAAAGSIIGNCAKDVFVDQPPVDVCPDIPGFQTDQNQCVVCEKSKDKNDATACLILVKTAKNNTQNIANANGTTAKAGDVITYTLSTTNNSKVTLKNYPVAENVTDILEYATITDHMGSTMAPNHTLLWAGTDIKPGQTIQKQFVIKIKDPIPQTPASASDPSSYDMKLVNFYGDSSVTINLPPSIIKATEQTTKALPNTGPGTNLMIGFVITTIAGYFMARNRLLGHELEIVKADYSSGAL